MNIITYNRDVTVLGLSWLVFCVSLFEIPLEDAHAKLLIYQYKKKLLRDQFSATK